MWRSRSRARPISAVAAPRAALQVGRLLREGHRGDEIGAHVDVGHGLHGEGLRLAERRDAGLRDQRHLDRVVARRRERAARLTRPGGREARRGEVDGVGGGAAEVPGDAVEAAPGGAHDAPDGVAGSVPYQHGDARPALLGLGGEALVAGKGDVLAALPSRALFTAPLLAHRLGHFGEPVGEGGAEVRVGRGERGSCRGSAGRSPGAGCWGRTTRRPARGTGSRPPPARPGGHLPERRVVVQDVEAAAEGRAHQVIVAALDLQITERDRGGAVAQQDPVVAPVRRKIDAVLGAEE